MADGDYDNQAQPGGSREDVEIEDAAEETGSAQVAKKREGRTFGRAKTSKRSSLLHLPEASVYGETGKKWDLVIADLQNVLGRSISINPIKAQLRKLYSSLSREDDVSKKSGQPCDKDEILEEFRAYVLLSKDRQGR